ncbi:3-dehydroquinate synthase II [Pseudogulbenkiania subflava]|uniref:3-amino-4-hydroxybenzoic acid synthase n=1 Tax=Pseudogulbenkiania subflava DSM 22618 TaxID=1123014 RepID=A0A1Y6BLA2_9NEIS|nr:3-dehydroquinate synthase II [Pseudogulbenkiania subflava]SMF17087.1 3-amino-4-hydroxybenzoic acid synthase [Pseudogulbenkiania subflava DSM 22618]
MIHCEADAVANRTDVVHSKHSTRPRGTLSSSTQRNGVTVHGAGETLWWFDARDLADEALKIEVEQSNCTHLVLTPDQLETYSTTKQRVVWVERLEQLDTLPADVWVFTSEEELRLAAAARQFKAGLMINVVDLQKDFPRCVAVCSRGDDFVVIDIEHATYIPYELLLAKIEDQATQVLRSVPIKGLRNVVEDVDQSLNALATMEQGVGVLFHTRDCAAVRSLSLNLRGRQSSRIALVEAEVVEVQHTGLGHRVCVDTTSMMTAEEGMIIGSTGWGGIFVCSETHFLPHMNLREFRVNAGAVHSYIWGTNGEAMYLSEMEAGSAVLCANKDGTARVVSIGRAKIERRPMLKVMCRVSIDQISEEIREAARVDARLKRGVTPDGEDIASTDERYVYINTFLQNDWHVRVMGADGKVRHCTLLQPGDKLLAHVDAPGRHTGLRVTEHILEK